MYLYLKYLFFAQNSFTFNGGRSTSPNSVTSDPLFRMQWHLNKGARGGFDMNVKPAWDKG